MDDSRPHSPSPALRAKVRLGRSRLDRQIALDRPYDDTPELALRAQQLLDARSQHAIAHNIRSVVQTAERLASRQVITSVVIDPARVLRARRALLELAERFERAGPASPRGVVLAHRLLSDGLSPLFIGHSEQSVTGAVRSVHEALEERSSRNRYVNPPIRHAAVTHVDR
jgi:hypothetical protein